MERTSRLSIASRTDVFETRQDTRTAGTGFSPADITLEASASALEATATRRFDFMEDMPLDARGRTGTTGKRGGPRGDKRTAPGCTGGSGRRVASLFELLQELSSPRAQSSTTHLGRTPPRATACPQPSKSLPGGTSSSEKTASTGLREASGAADRHEHETNGETEGIRLRSVSGRENALAQSSLGEPAKPALRREDYPRAFASKEARRVTFVGTRGASLEHATIGTAAPPPAPPVTLLNGQWPVSGSAAIIPSRPKRPTGIHSIGSAKGRRPHRDPAQGATKRVALSNVTPGNSRGGNKRASATLTASAARSEVLPKMASSIDHAHVAEDESGYEERSSKRRQGYPRELQGGSTLVGAAGRSESKRRDVVGVGRLSRGEPARGREGGGWVSPAERAVEQMPRVGTGSKQGVPQGEYGTPTGRGGIVVDPRTNQDRTTGMWMWQDEGDLLDSEQQGSIESRSQSQAPEVQSAGQVRSIRPASEQAERKLGIERQDEGRAAAAAAAADTGGSALMERRDGGLAQREARTLDNGEKERSYGTGAGDDKEEEEGHKADPKRELVRVRGLCHMRGAILALVEWSVVDTEGSTGSELSFMLSSALRADWPQQYITFLEERMVFNTEEEDHGTRGEAPGNPSSAAAKGVGSALELWKPGQPTTSRLPA